MKLTKERLKEIIKEEFQALNEKTIKTSNIKIEMSTKNGYPLLKLRGPRGSVEVYGRPDITQFCKVLAKNFRI